MHLFWRIWADWSHWRLSRYHFHACLSVCLSVCVLPVMFLATLFLVSRTLQHFKPSFTCFRVPAPPGKSWKVLDLFFLNFQDLEGPGNEIGPGNFWKLKCRVWYSKVLKFDCDLNYPMRVGPSLGSYLLKHSDNKFWNIWHSMCNVCGYCIFVYSTLGQVCWSWVTPCTIGSVAHVQYRASWTKRFGGHGKSWKFF